MDLPHSRRAPNTSLLITINTLDLSDSDSSIHGNCHLCKTKGHFVANCPELEMAGKLLRKYHHEQARAKAKTEKKAQFDNHSASKARAMATMPMSSLILVPLLSLFLTLNLKRK